MARMIVRYSLDAGHPNEHGKARKILEEGGLTKIGTAVYEGDFPATGDAIATLQDLLSHLSAIASDMDHLWVYVDEATPS